MEFLEKVITVLIFSLTPYIEIVHNFTTKRQRDVEGGGGGDESNP